MNEEFLSQSQIGNLEYDCNVLRRLRKDIRREKTRIGYCIMTMRQQFFGRNSMPVLTSYLPNSASCDFGLFSIMKVKLRGRHFDTLKEIQAEWQITLNQRQYNSSLGTYYYLWYIILEIH